MIEIQAEIPDKLFSSEKIDKLIKELALQIRSKFIPATPRDTGDAQRSYTPVKRHEGGLSYSGGAPSSFPVERKCLGYSFGNVQPYAHILESGSTRGHKPWPSVGPRTVEQDGKIYSSQAPGGISSKAEIENFVDEALPQLVKKYLKD